MPYIKLIDAHGDASELVLVDGQADSYGSLSAPYSEATVADLAFKDYAQDWQAFAWNGQTVVAATPEGRFEAERAEAPQDALRIYAHYAVDADFDETAVPGVLCLHLLRRGLVPVETQDDLGRPTEEIFYDRIVSGSLFDPATVVLGDPVVRQTHVYQKNALDWAEKVTTTTEYYKRDGTLHPTARTSTRHLAPKRSRDEGIAKRADYMHGIEMTVYNDGLALIGVTGSMFENFTAAQVQARLIEFLDVVGDAKARYIEDQTRSLRDDVNGLDVVLIHPDHAWIDENMPSQSPAATFRAFIVAELDAAL